MGAGKKQIGRPSRLSLAATVNTKGYAFPRLGLQAQSVRPAERMRSETLVSPRRYVVWPGGPVFARPLEPVLTSFSFLGKLRGRRPVLHWFGAGALITAGRA